MRTTMSLANNKTSELWQQFMQRRKEIKNISNSNLYSIQVFDESLEFKDFNPNTEFEKWAAVEISDLNDIPEDLETYTLKFTKDQQVNFKKRFNLFSVNGYQTLNMN